jgi:hypothetical protein
LLAIDELRNFRTQAIELPIARPILVNPMARLIQSSASFVVTIEFLIAEGAEQ